jgi:hypothetical protein
MLFEASRGEARTRRPAVFPAGTAVAYTQQTPPEPSEPGREPQAKGPRGVRPGRGDRHSHITARTTGAFEGAGA